MIFPIVILLLSVVSITLSLVSLVRANRRARESRQRLSESLTDLHRSAGLMDVSLRNSYNRMEAMRKGEDWTPYETMMCEHCFSLGLVGKLDHSEDCPNAGTGWRHRGG